MRYHALACDYDGTIATHGRVDEATLDALEHVRASGRKLLLVTGRQLEDLRSVFPHLHRFDRVVAENGALLLRPAEHELVPLGAAPEPELVEALAARGVEPLSVGRSIVATWEPHQAAALEVIRELGLERQIVFNKGAVMLLPSGVNKATGLERALHELGLSAHNAVGIGDAENDNAFLDLCECGVAVRNALPALRQRVDLVTEGDHGAGVIELIDRLLRDDLADLGSRLNRHDVPVGTREDGEIMTLPGYGMSVLVAGSSGSGKSTFVTSLLERWMEGRYQVCVVDPEGDYREVPGATTIGNSDRAPTRDDVLELLQDPLGNIVVNLLGIALHDRPAFFDALLSALVELRSRTGRPHWLVLDEAHHLLPVTWHPTGHRALEELTGIVLVTVHPERLSRAMLDRIDVAFAIGDQPSDTLSAFAQATDAPARFPATAVERGEALAWSRRGGAAPVRVRTILPRGEIRRHHRKYAEGELGDDRSFYFRGPEGKLNLKAYNLEIFLELADGVDDDTWLWHLERGDYARWFREMIRDEELAGETERVRGDARESRAAIRRLIEERYTRG